MGGCLKTNRPFLILWTSDLYPKKWTQIKIGRGGISTSHPTCVPGRLCALVALQIPPQQSLTIAIPQLKSEGEGFEPSRALLPYGFSRAAVSTGLTHPSIFLENTFPLKTLPNSSLFFNPISLFIFLDEALLPNR